MAKDFQIIQLGADGTPTVFHPETNADKVLAGLVNKVPTIENINDWTARSKELIEARKGKISLKAKMDEIDTSLTPAKLLEAIKTVDGTNSGLDADTVDGRQVDDEGSVSTLTLWTSHKINNELGKKLNSNEVSSVAAPNKILKLNASSKLVVDIEGNAKTASSFVKAISLNLKGDVTGSFSILGNETSAITINTVIQDDSHNHTYVSNGNSTINVGTTDIAEFKKNGVTLSKINAKGDFTGDAASVGGVRVNNGSQTQSLWTSDKILEVLKANTTLSEETGTIELGGLIKIKYGTINLSGETATANFTGLSKVLFDGFSLESEDNTLLCFKKPGSATSAKIEYTLNKEAMSGKLTWFVVGI